MQDFEKLGVFYLGKTEQGPLLYESKDLTTHAVCVGMTGSGKTGLCLSLLEEAAIDGIPAIVIDPKGDLSNLLLTFPDLAPADFRPWISEDEARKKGVSPDDLAASTAKTWSDGLGKWGQDGARIARLRAAADFAIYTPGSNAGLPVSVLRTFAAPPAAMRDDREAMRDRIGSTATALLSLLGIDADPIQSREHILVSTILGNAWQQGKDLDLPGLIQAIQKPPVTKIGVMDLESFYPSKERFALAMQLNNLLASPGFEAWLEGEPLDASAMLYTQQGKPRISIFSIAHLSDAERMFFVSLLLNQTLAWIRSQPGTTSLRAILYMDEIFGYFPPVANPPSKQPLLTLLKQARAFGLGIVLATQNPVDLDYKGLANCGTWFIGRLQTERDKARLVDGLQGAAQAGGAPQNPAVLDKLLSSLGNRIFLMNNVHTGSLDVFESRWAMSYLCGPLTRSQIKLLMDPRKSDAAASPEAAAAPVTDDKPDASAAKPMVPPEIAEHFLPTDSANPVYQAMCVGAATVRFSDAKSGIDVTREVVAATPITTEAVAVKWEDGEVLDLTSSDIDAEHAENAAFGDLPPAAAKVKNYATWSKDFATWLAANQTVELFKSPTTGDVSNIDESERDFRARIGQAAREQRDDSVAAIKAKYATKVNTAENKVREAEQAVARESQQKTGKALETALSFGASLLGAFLGGKSLEKAAVSSVGKTVRGIDSARREGTKEDQAKADLADYQAQLKDLQDQLNAEIQQVQAATDPQTEELLDVVIRPKKTNISVRLVGLAWKA